MNSIRKYVNITSDNINVEHLCCLIRTKTINPGIEAKKKWLSERIKEGHIFRKLDVDKPAFIEYAPLEKAWVPIVGNNYYYVYCLWTVGEYRGKGYGKELLDYCIEEAKRNNKSGICVLGSIKQKAWLTDQEFMKKHGFEVCDRTSSGYELLALSFDGTKPTFSSKAKKEEIDNNDITIYFTPQCPYIYQNITKIKEHALQKNISINIEEVDSLEKAKDMPAPFNNWALFYKGKLVTINIVGCEYIDRLVSKK